MSSNVTSGISRLELLSKDNYDTWSMQVEALLVKNDLWEYVNGTLKQPDGESSASEIAKWSKSDNKAKADLVLSIQSSQLKQVRGCKTSREMWIKLQSIYSSKGPARKATLLKQLILQRLEYGGDVKEHILKFFDIVDKLEGMEVPINGDLLSIMLLYSLPKTFENFRCAIECRDELPKADVLKVKIIEEAEARKSSSGNAVIAMAAQNKTRSISPNQIPDKRVIKCFKCGKIGHKANMCFQKKKKQTHKNISCEAQSYAAFHTGDGSADLSWVSKNHMWILDSGCTAHLCGDKNSFSSMCNGFNSKLNLASMACAEVKGKGVVNLKVSNKNSSRMLELRDVLYVPDLRTNLISVSKITNKGHKVIFSDTGAHVFDTNGNIMIIADRYNDLFVVREPTDCANVQHSSEDLLKWHCRLGHLNLKDMQNLVSRNILPAFNTAKTDTIIKCVVCAKGKMVATPFSKNNEKCSEILKIIHSDVVGPFRIESLQKERYFVTFIDECTRWCHIYFLRDKADVFKAFKMYHKLVENQTGRRIKFLQSDNGREYINRDFDDYLSEHGIVRRLTIPRTPQQNGMAERYNRTIIDMTRCLLIESGLSDSFWAVAVAAACYIRNRCPCSGLNALTPYEKWFNMKPNLKNLHVFGAKVMVLDKSPNNSKLSPKSYEGVFVGYSNCRKGFRVWVPHRRLLVESRDVKFIEEFPSCLTNPRSSVELLNESALNESPDDENNHVEFISSIGNNDEQPQLECQQQQKRGRGRPKILRTGNKGRPRKMFNSLPKENGVIESNIDVVQNIVNADVDHEPDVANDGDISTGDDEVFTDAEGEVFAGIAEINVTNALKGPDAEEWLDAIECEIKSILVHDTWDVIKLKDTKNAVGCRFVLTNKYSADGKIDRRKARLVAKGFSQQYGLNYNYTFAPVARLETLRLLLALAVHLKFIIWQFDVVTAYLNGVLDEEVNMKVPDMLVLVLQRIISKGQDSDVKARANKMLKDIDEGGNVCKLKKSLYGLKQAGRQWYLRLRDKLVSIGLKTSKNEPCLFYGTLNGESLLLLVYVDDLLAASSKVSTIMYLKQLLLTDFQIKDIGQAHYCLGLEIFQNNTSIMLKQKGYIENLLRLYGMEHCNPVATPGEPNMHSKIESSMPYIGGAYRELIGALMYLSVASRPDISNVVVRLAQFVNSPLNCHWKSAKRVLRYLAGSADKGLIYNRTNEVIVGYSDSDWGGCAIERRSYTGYTFIISGAAVIWKSQKQKTVALSSTEAEYVSLAEASKEAVYLKNLLTEIGLSNLATIKVYVDNRGAQFLANNPALHGRTKHIDIKYHFVRSAVDDGIFELKHIPTQEMVADIMTKPLPRFNHQKCLDGLGIQ